MLAAEESQSVFGPVLPVEGPDRVLAGQTVVAVAALLVAGIVQPVVDTVADRTGARAAFGAVQSVRHRSSLQ